MAKSFTECLKTIKISKTDKALIRQIESEYKADGIDGKTAISNAIDDVLNGDVAGEYSLLENQIAEAGGYVDPFSVYIAGPVDEPITPVSPETQAKVDEIASTPEPEEPASVDPYGQAARDGGFTYVGRFKNYIAKAEADNDLTPDEIAPFLEPSSKGTVGSPEVKKAVAKALSEREKVTSPDRLTNTEAEIEQSIEREMELFEAKGDFSEEAELDHAKKMATYFELLDEIEAARNADGEVSNASKRNSTFQKVIDIDPEAKPTLIKLRGFYKSQGISGAEAEALAASEYMQRAIARSIEIADLAEADVIRAEDRAAGVRRKASSTARASDLLESGPTTTGIGNRGIQGILKSQGAPRVDRRLEGQSTVDAEEYRTTSEIIDELDGKPVEGLDVAKALAEAPRMIDGKMQLSNAPVKFIANKRITQGSTSLKKGQTGWYDPITSRFYDDEQNMRIARGDFTRTPTKKIGGKKAIQRTIAKAKAEREARNSQLSAENEAEAEALARAEGVDITTGKPFAELTRAERQELARAKSGASDDAYADQDGTESSGGTGMLDLIQRELEDLNKSYAEKAAELRRRIAMAENPPEADPARDATLRDAQASVGDIPAGRRLTLMRARPNKDGTHDMRVIRDNQLARGDGVSALLGQKGKPEEWIVGHVPDDVRPGRRDPSLFESVDAENPNPALIPEKIPNEHKRPAKWADIQDQEIPAEFSQFLASVSTFKPSQIKTVMQANGLIARMESKRWHITKKSHQQNAADLAEAYRYMETIAPNGIEFPVATKQEAMDSIGKIFSKHDPKVVAGLKRLIMDLNSDTAPVITDSMIGNSRHVASAPDERMNKINMSIEGEVLSDEFVMAHELGHWLYFNVMPNTDKAKFWKAAEKYFDSDGALDRSGIQNSVMDVGSIAPNLQVRSNASTSPQELFADQFAMYVAQTGRYNIGDPGLWKQIVKYAQAIYDRVMDKKAIDPDLEPLFAKLLIDPDDAARHAAVKPRVGELTPQGKYVEFHWNELNDVDKRLQEAVMMDDPEQIIQAADDLTLIMLKMIPSKKAQRELGKNPTGAFGPLKVIRNQIRTKVHQLQHVMRGAKDDSIGEYTQEAATEYDPELGFSTVQRVIPEGFDRIHNYGDPEKVAEAIKDFIYDTDKGFGKAGETGSMIDAIDLMRKTLENAMLRSIPEGSDIDATLAKSPEAFREGVKNGRPESPKTAKYRKRWQTMQRNREMMLQNQAEEWAGGKGETLVASGRELPDIKGMSPTKLAKLYQEHEGTKEGQSIMHEVLRQAKLATKPVGRPKVTKEQASLLSHATRDDLYAQLRTALEEGKPREVDRYIWEMQRRDFNKLVKRNKGAGKNGTRIKVLTPDSDEVSNASAIEIEDSIGGVIDGIPRNARFTIRDALGMITHRNPAIQADSRTLAYRMFNLMGRAAKATTEDANLLTMQDVYRLSRSTKASPTATSVMADFASEEYKMLRSDLRRVTVGLSRGKSDPFDLMHEIGHVLMRTNVISERERGSIITGFQNAKDPIAEAVRRRKFDGMPQHMVMERQAEEWFVENWAQYLGERVAKGDVFNSRIKNRPEDIELRGTLSTLLDRIIEAAAYALNGLIGRDDIKQTFRRLTLFGDMVETPSHRAPNLERRQWVSPELAAGRFANVYESANPATKARIKSFMGGGLVDADGEPKKMYIGMPNASILDDGEIVFSKSGKGNLGPAIYATDDASIANDIYARKPTFEAWRKNIDMSDMPAHQKEEAVSLAFHLSQYRQAISADKVRLADVRARIESGSTQDDFLDAGFADANTSIIDDDMEMEKLIDRIETYEGFEREFHDQLMSMDVNYNPGVMNVYMRAVNTADLSKQKLYSKNDALSQSMVRFATIKMLNEGATSKQIDSTIGRIGDHIDAFSGISGHDLHEMTWKALETISGDKDKSIAAVTNFLTDQGYDSIKHTHVNTREGERVPHTVTALIDTIGPNGEKVSPSSRIKHQDARYFDHQDDRLYYSEPMDNPLSATVANMSLVETDYDSKMAYLLQNAEERGTPSSVTNPMRKITKGRVLSEEEVDGIHRASVAERTLAPNSQRMRNTGMNWLANFTEEYFPAVHNQFASRYMPIRALLADLPDTPGRFKGWMFKNNPVTGGLHTQPDSHMRILQALREGPSSRKWKVLDQKEIAAAQSIRETMAKIHGDLVATDSMVGNIQNYMPNVWMADKITQDQEGFELALMRYLKSEDPSRDTARAREIAEKITANIINDDGIYIPPPVPHSGGVEGNLDYQRLIRLDEHPGLYKEFEPFMQNNLDGLLVKYLDGATKRLHQANNLGVNVHGFADYMDIGQNGLPAITRLLSTPKVFTKQIKGQDPLTDSVETATMERVMTMPFQNPMEARDAGLEAIRQYREHGLGATKSYLMGLMPEQKITPTYRRRMDAIANAIADFKLNEEGMPKAINRSEFDHAEGTLRVLQGQSVNPRESEMAMNASRAVRAVNNISLLSFTALTSIPDAVLPLIRSASFKDWARGIAKFAADPEYRQEIKNTGVAIENALHGRMVGMYGADARGTWGTAQTAFFNATMLTPWTDMWRGISGSVALESFNTQITKGIRGYKPGVEPQNQPRDVKFATRFLKRYGLDDKIQGTSAKLDPRDPRVAKAMIKFANDTIFSPNPNDVPLAFQTPGGAILFQLKSFPLMMGRFAKDVLINDIKQGNLKRPMYFAAFAPTMGMAAVGTKDLIQSRGGEEGTSREFRERNAGQFAKLLGYDPEIHGNEDTFMGWYLEGLMAAGGFGLLGDIMHDITAQADNGAYGIQRTAGAILGPTFGLGASAVNLAGGVKEATMDQFDVGTTGTNSKERLAAREMLGRIPVLGGMKNVRETGVDFFAGEKTTKGGGWGSSFGT